MLDVQDVERVEVVKGPASAWYGSSAMGGVINIVTRRRTGAPSGLVSASAGSFGASEFRLQGGGRIPGWFDADVSVRRYDQRDDFTIGGGNSLRSVFGRDSALKIYPTGAKPNRFVADTLGDGVTRTFTTLASTSGNLRVGGNLSDRLRIDVRGDLFDAQDVASPGDLYSAGTLFPGNGRKDVRRAGGSADLAGTFGSHALLARMFTTDETSDNYNRPDSVRYVSFASQARTTGLQVQDVVQVRGQQVVFGIDATQQNAISRRFLSSSLEAGTFSPNSQVASLAAFGETRVTALDGRLVATLGARADRVTLSLLATPLRSDVTPGDATFTVFNPSAGVLYALGGGVRAHGSVGRAFLAPDAFGRAGLTQSVAVGVAAITFGNPALKSENSVTTDVGVGITRLGGAFDADVTYFATSVTESHHHGARILRSGAAAGTRRWYTGVPSADVGECR